MLSNILLSILFLTVKAVFRQSSEIETPSGLKEDDIVELKGTIASVRSPALFVITAPFAGKHYSVMKMQIQGARNRLLFESGWKYREEYESHSRTSPHCNLGRNLVAPRKKFAVTIRVLSSSLKVHWNGELKFTLPLTHEAQQINRVMKLAVWGLDRIETFRVLTDTQIANALQSRDCGLITSGKLVPPFCTRGSSGNVNCRVVGGTAAAPGQHPWQAAIRKKSHLGNRVAHVCGATLIGSWWAVTAAHCFSQNLLLNLNQLVVRVGDYYNRDHSIYSNIRSAEQSVDVDIAEVFLPESFISSYRRGRDDIALVKLKTRVSFNDFVRPACLPTSLNQFKEGTACGVSGWGASNVTHHELEYPPCLQVAAVSIKGNQTCKNAYSQNFDGERMMCAGNPCVDTCRGDSGGPLICTELNSGKFTLWGITSRGESCANQYRPGIYTKVAKYMRWLYIKISLSPTDEALKRLVQRRLIPENFCQHR